MGILDSFRAIRTTDVQPTLEPQVRAAFENQFLPTWWSTSIPRISRQRAVTVPAVMRSRNLIAGTIGSLPLHRYNRFDGRRLPEIPLQYQPDPSWPASTFWAYVVDSMIFYGGSYCQIISLYADNKIQHLRWLDPSLVQEIVDHNNKVVGYNYDGTDLPRTGVGSVIYFPSFEDGVLARGGKTIETAIELEDAANRAAKEPAPQVILKNEGVSLPSAKIQDLLAGWKAARRERATAYLDASMKIETVGFDPRSQQLVEGRQFHASEIARLMNLPGYYLGAEMTSMTYSNVESERRNLVDFSLLPYMVSVQDRLNMPDFSTRDVQFRFGLEGFLRGNALERVDVTVKLLESGIIDIDEAREFEDLAPRGNENASNI